MKKILISLLIVLLLVLTIITVKKGLRIGQIQIMGFDQIKQSYTELDKSIADATVLASTNYKETVDTLESDVKKLKEEKKKYDELIALSSESEAKNANQYQKYEIEYLWTELGNHATREGVILKMDLTSGTGSNVYNLNFTVTGEYIRITDFISDIENDSALGFKIENFNLIPDTSTANLRATFICRDITIKNISNDTTTTTGIDGLIQTNNDKETTDENTTNTETNTTSGNTTTGNTTTGNTITGNTTTGNTTTGNTTTGNTNSMYSLAGEEEPEE